MARIKIIREIEAEQWTPPDAPAPYVEPRGTFICKPEVCWSADRTLVYFTYAEFHPMRWMQVAIVPAEPLPGVNDAFSGGVVFTPTDGSPTYARRVFQFMFYNVKSESSVKRDWQAQFLDESDAGMVRLWQDYCLIEGWAYPPPPRLEYREVDGKFGRGYRPVYMKPGDWLLRDTVPDGHNNLGKKEVVTVVDDATYQQMGVKESV